MKSPFFFHFSVTHFHILTSPNRKNLHQHFSSIAQNCCSGRTTVTPSEISCQSDSVLMEKVLPPLNLLGKRCVNWVTTGEDFCQCGQAIKILFSPLYFPYNSVGIDLYSWMVCSLFTLAISPFKGAKNLPCLLEKKVALKLNSILRFCRRWRSNYYCEIYRTQLQAL